VRKSKTAAGNSSLFAMPHRKSKTAQENDGRQKFREEIKDRSRKLVAVCYATQEIKDRTGKRRTAEIS
jgi:hypothetical protein